MGTYKKKTHMAVQQEVKSQLAKLLATEDIVVEHKQVETAQFNVQTRVLILPLWEKASNAVYDMLVGHEVGHALFTPNEDPPQHIPHNFLNVCEDARIEKLMKRKYMGLAKSFYNGYNELHDQDFFDLEDEDIDDFNLADRANLYFKIGSFLNIPFSTPEKEIIDLISNAETFIETIAAAEALYNYCKQEQEKQKEFLENADQAKLDFENDSDDSGDSSTSIPTDLDPTVPDTDASSSLEDRSDSTPSNDRVVNTGSTVDDLDVHTLESLDSKLKDLVNTNGVENVYVEVPEVNLDIVIASNKEVHDDIQKFWDVSEVEFSKAKKEREETYGSNDWYPETLFNNVDLEYRKFKKEAQKEVSYLVKEFECKKAASSYARATTSRTGVLDTSHLYSYRYNDDLFKKVTTLADGKNHGLVFILDWSGSMQYVLQDTLKQLYNLIWFCKKVQIPFEVYAFTNEWSGRKYNYSSSEYENTEPKLCYEEKEGSLVVDTDFNLMNLLTSKVNGKTLEQQLINIWRIAESFTCSRGQIFYRYPPRLCLSGTPLNEALVSLHQILPKFQKENGVEKTQCIVFTDGEAHQLPHNTEVKRSWEDDVFMGRNRANGDRCFLRDRKLGRTYRLGWGYHEFTDALIRNLKDKFPATNFIGIRVLASRDAKSFMRLYYHNEHYGYNISKEYDIIMNDWKRNKSFNIKNSGYDAYFGLSSSALSQDSEFDVDESATKAQIKRAFVKSLKTKKLNKKVLGEFISLVV